MGLEKPRLIKGKMFAEGASLLTDGRLTINNLSFTPSKVLYTVLGQINGWASSQTGAISDKADYQYYGNGKTTNFYARYYDNGSPPSTVGEHSGNAIIPNGFTVYASAFSNASNVKWWAYE